MKNKKRKGFTLPEVLAVVAVIILLVGISVPLYQRLIQRSEVSDALHDLDMLTAAQNKYFMSNGKYTRNLSSLDTPLKGEDPSITTVNFIYSAGKPTEGNTCVYSKSRKNDYTLAWNYKTHEGPICSGSFCPEIDDKVPEGSLTDLCGTPFDEECDITCTPPKVLDPRECVCTCENSCGALSVQSSNCSCVCVGQAVLAPNGKECECPSSVEAGCVSAGKRFDSSTCDCTDCGLQEEDCTSIGKIFNLSKCICEDSDCNKDCPVGKILDKETCDCVCGKRTPCSSNQIFNEETCACDCNLNQTKCEEMGKEFNAETCSCGCSTDQIGNCTSPYQVFNSDCSCTCNKPANYASICDENYSWDDAACDCKCTLQNGHKCPLGKVLDLKACACVAPENCSLQDSDCPEGEIADTEKCACVPSSCPPHDPCNNGTWDDRNCQCVCGLTVEYCKEHGNKILDERTCECTSCAIIEKECIEVGKVLNSSTCLCECTQEQRDACQGDFNEEDCSCSCVEPAPSPCQGNATFNNDPTICDCECGYSCSDPWELNESLCKCDCTLNEDKCKKINENYAFRTSGEETCECYCSLDEDKCRAQNANYTFTGESECSCTCGLSDESCQETSGNSFYGVNNQDSCECACSSTLLNAEINRLNAPISGKKGPFWEANISNCAPRCPIPGDEWCISKYGANYLADMGDCTCYASSCSEQTCYGGNGNGHWDFRECKCVCDIDNSKCSSQGKVFDAETCSCKDPCALNPAECVSPFVFHDSPYNDCSCDCGLTDDNCYKDHNKILENPPCECTCGNTCDDGYVLRQSDCECTCNKDDNWCKTHNGNNAHYVFEPPCGCECNLTPSDCGSSGNWVVNDCACECPASVATACADEGRGFDAEHCTCSDCLNSSSCTLPKAVNESCDCLCSYYTKEGSSAHYDSCPSGFDQNEANCTCPCNVECKSGETRHIDTCTCTCDKAPYGNYVVNENCEYACRSDIADFCSPKGYSGCECTSCQISCAYPHQVQDPNTCECTQCDDLTCTGNWVKDPSTCDCTCPASVQESCEDVGKGFDEGTCQCTGCQINCAYPHQVQDPNTCECTQCDDLTCTGNWVKDPSTCDCTCPASVEENCENIGKGFDEGTCQCTTCQINCAYPHQVQNPDTCDCTQCDNLSCTGNWVKDPNTCDCTCPASVEENCENIGKGFDAETCQCTTCQTNCSYPHQVQNPETCSCTQCDSLECTGFKEKDLNTCECSICNVTALNNYYNGLGGGLWVKDESSCTVFCPNNAETTCSNQGKNFDAENCRCTECANPCLAGFTQHEDCSCHCDKNPAECTGNFELLSDAEHCACNCPSDMADTCSPKGINWTTCECTTCQISCAYPHQVQDPDTCECSCDSLSCTGNWVKDPSTCECTCPASVQQACEDIGKGFDEGTCQCTTCLEDCEYTHQVQDPDTCDCSQCDDLSCTGNWIKDPSTCDCTCPSSIQESCEDIGKGFDAGTCQCTGCQINCAYPHQVQDPDTCECTQCDSLECTGNWIKDPSTCNCTCPASVQESCEDIGKGFDAGSCQCTTCQINCAYPHQIQDPDTCECTQCDNLSCTGNWIKDPSTCDCTCPASVQESCEDIGKGYDPDTCQCTGCQISCAYPHQVQDPNTCACSCDDLECTGFFLKNSTTCECDICDKASLDAQLAALIAPGDTHWMADDTDHYCQIYCPDNLPTICDGMDYDFSQCKCLGCAESCPDGFTQQPDCSCACEKKPSDCVGNWELLSDSENCRCYCPASVEENCIKQNKKYNAETCSCTDCAAQSCTPYWTMNPLTCQCSDCDISDSFCSDLHGGNTGWKARTGGGHCDCDCSIKGNTGCATLHGGNTNWLLSQECECYCKETAEAECTAKGSNFEYVPSECLCRCKKPCSDPEAYQDPETCECTTSCDKDPSECKSPWVLNTDPEVCECECGMNNYECPGDWIVNPTTCDCSKCSLSNDYCASSHNNNTNYVVNGSTCTCECGINSCPGEKELSDCNCVCNKSADYCKKMYGNTYVLNEETCTCQEDTGCELSQSICTAQNENTYFNSSACRCDCMPETEQKCIAMGMSFDAVNCRCNPLCNWNLEKCQALNPNYIFNSSECSCECGINSSNCKGKKAVFDPENCECVESCPWSLSLCQSTYNTNYWFNDKLCSCECGLDAGECKGINTNWTLLPDCTCGCPETATCTDPYTAWNPETCDCEPLTNCVLTGEYCKSLNPNYILTYDHSGNCQCSCSLTKYSYCPPGLAPVLGEVCACLSKCAINFQGGGHDEYTCSQQGMALNMTLCQCEPSSCPCTGPGCSVQNAYCVDNIGPTAFYNMTTCDCSVSSSYTS